MGLANIEKKDFDKAADALAAHRRARAGAADVPDVVRHRALREGRRRRAKRIRRSKANKKPEEIDPDLVGRELREGEPGATGGREAQRRTCGARTTTSARSIARPTSRRRPPSEFREAIKSNPREWGPYVALGELYRKWDYTDQAITVASQGTANVPGSTDQSDIWYVLGMGYEDKANEDKAIEAFTKAIETKKDNHKAKFQRGQAYFRKGDMTERQARPRGVLQVRWRVARVREAAGEQDADGHRREERDAERARRAEALPEDIVKGTKGAKGKKH